jgi:hypothetical protein
MSSVIDSFFSTVNDLFFPEDPPVVEIAEEIKPLALREEWFPSRPTLTSPQHLPMSDLRLLAVTEATRELGGEIIEALSARLQGIKSRIKEISQESMQMLREAAERAQESLFWSILKKVATAIISAVSVIFGISVVSSGSALIGGAMIASGVLSLANFALSELKGWDWVAEQIAQGNEERKKQLLNYLPMAVGILAGGIGLLGSVNGIATGAINFAERALMIVQSILAVFEGTTLFGKGVSEARLLWAKADLKTLQADLLIERENFNATLDELRGSLDDFKNISKRTQKVVDMITQSNIQLTRQT